MLDEIEELDLVLEHYVVAWGSKGLSGEGEAWGLVQEVVEIEEV